LPDDVNQAKLKNPPLNYTENGKLTLDRKEPARWPVSRRTAPTRKSSSATKASEAMPDG